MVQAQAVRTASFGMGLLSLGTILGCLAVPPLAERIGRKRTLAIYLLGMAVVHPAQLRLGVLPAKG